MKQGWKDGLIGQQLRLMECFLGIFIKKDPFEEMRDCVVCPCKGLTVKVILLLIVRAEKEIHDPLNNCMFYQELETNS